MDFGLLFGLLHVIYPSQHVPAGSCRKTLEINGTWKQYSHQKVFGIFLMYSDRFLANSNHFSVIYDGFLCISQETIEKSQEKIRKIPAEISFPFSTDFRKFSQRAGVLSHFYPIGFACLQRPESSTWVYYPRRCFMKQYSTKFRRKSLGNASFPAETRREMPEIPGSHQAIVFDCQFSRDLVGSEWNRIDSVTGFFHWNTASMKPFGISRNRPRPRRACLI
jgi:hypothetical protein